MSKILIIGAGPAGLSAAYELSGRGISTTVLEADEQIGGLSRTVEYRGYRFDIGGHRFFSRIPLINDLWQEILGDELLLRRRLSRIHYEGYFFDYPLKPINALRGLGPVEAVRVAASYAWAQTRKSGGETNFEQWVSNRFGPRLYEIFFKTYTEKVWGMPCSEISADWAVQRIKNLSLKEAVRDALFKDGRKAGARVTSLVDQFHYPRLGPGMMWDRCAERVAERGGKLIRGVRVERIRYHRGGIMAVTGRNRDGGQVEFDADRVISTMALSDLVGVLDPVPPVEVRRAAQALRYRDYLTVVLIVRREHLFPDNWIYVHTPHVKLGRVQNYKNWSAAMVPDPSHTSLGLEYFLSQGEAEWDWPGDRLIEAGVRDCTVIGLIQADEVVDGTVVRMPKAYPVYDQDYRRNVSVIRDYLTSIPGLQTVGRNGQHRYNNQDHSMLTGIYAARNLAGERWQDVWAVNTELEYGESVVIDRAVPERAAPAQGRPETNMDEVLEQVFARLDPLALGAAFAVTAGAGLFLATAVLLLKGGAGVGSTLSLVGQYLPGFRVTWAGSIIGFLDAGAVGFAVGVATAGVRNTLLRCYGAVQYRRAVVRARRELIGRL